MWALLAIEILPAFQFAVAPAATVTVPKFSAWATALLIVSSPPELMVRPVVPPSVPPSQLKTPFTESNPAPLNAPTTDIAPVVVTSLAEPRASVPVPVTASVCVPLMPVPTCRMPAASAELTMTV